MFVRRYWPYLIIQESTKLIVKYLVLCISKSVGLGIDVSHESPVFAKEDLVIVHRWQGSIASVRTHK